jgi:ssDNA-specific exonuclease RecJ
MTQRQYNELIRQANVLEKDKEDKEFRELWEQFRIENPNTIGGFEEQFKSFRWLYKMLVTDKEKWINRHVK